MWNTSFKVDFVRQGALHLSLDYSTTRKSESQRFSLVGISSIKILYLSPLCQTLSKAFSTSQKATAACSPLLKLSITNWREQ